jgi:hypothetical protein
MNPLDIMCLTTPILPQEEIHMTTYLRRQCLHTFSEAKDCCSHCTKASNIETIKGKPILLQKDCSLHYTKASNIETIRAKPILL